MSLKGQAYIMGAYEHPLRFAPDKTTMQLRATVTDHADDSSSMTSGSFTMDRTPSAPTGLVATAGNAVVHLTWNRNPEVRSTATRSGGRPCR